MRYLLTILTILLLTACTVVQKNKFSFGLTTTLYSKSSHFIYIDSWANIKTGLISYKKPKNTQLIFTTQKNNSSLKIYIDDNLTLLSCTPLKMQKLEQAFNYIEQAFNAEFLQGFHSNLTLIKDKNYHYSQKIAKQSQRISFYLPFDHCNFFNQKSSNFFYHLVHEIAHIHMIQKHQGNTFNNLEHEYWANRLAQCAYIENVPHFHRSVDQKYVFTAKENHYLQTHIYKEMTGTTDLSATISSKILNNDFLLHLQEINATDLTSVNKKQVKNWCYAKPKKFSARQIRRILANTAT